MRRSRRFRFGCGDPVAPIVAAGVDRRLYDRAAVARLDPHRPCDTLGSPFTAPRCRTEKGWNSMAEHDREVIIHDDHGSGSGVGVIVGVLLVLVVVLALWFVAFGPGRGAFSGDRSNDNANPNINVDVNLPTIAPDAS
jgi:hypothetical protein